MTVISRVVRRFAQAAAVACAISQSAFALDYPTKPVRLIVGVAPGGANDTVARMVAQTLSERLGQPVVVENRPGAGGNIGLEAAANAPPDVMPAQVVFTDETSVFLGGKEVRAHHYGRGHTNGDAMVYFPLLKVLHTGDLMAGASPLIDYSGGGSVVEWTKTLDAAMKLDFDTVIPGHGAVTDKAGLLAYRNNVEKLRTRASGLIHDGKSQEDVGKVMTAEFGWAPDSLQMQWSVPGMMKELK